MVVLFMSSSGSVLVSDCVLLVECVESGLASFVTDEKREEEGGGGGRRRTEAIGAGGIIEEGKEMRQVHGKKQNREKEIERERGREGESSESSIHKEMSFP